MSKEPSMEDLDFAFPSTVRRVPEVFQPFNFNDNAPNFSSLNQHKQTAAFRAEPSIQFQNQNIFQQINITNQKMNPWEQDFEFDDPIMQQLIAQKEPKKEPQPSKGLKQLIINKQKKPEEYDLI
jgi:hypothetical protein